MKASENLICLIKLYVFLATAILLYANFYPHKTLADSPFFSRQEVKDEDNDWFSFNKPILEGNEQNVSEKTIVNLTGSSIGNIRSVSYVSNGATLNITYWLTSPFKKEIPSNHYPSYLAYIDADSNKQTGWNGIDYISEIAYDRNDKIWKSTLGEVSDSGYRLLEIKNFTGFNIDEKNTYLFLSLKLGALNYPELYRITFLMKDVGTNKYTNASLRVVDYVNTISIPQPKFIIYPSQNSLKLISNDKKTIEVGLKSLLPLPIFGDIKPKIYLFSENTPDGVTVNFLPNPVYLSSDEANTELTINTLPSINHQSYTIPIFS